MYASMNIVGYILVQLDPCYFHILRKRKSVIVISKRLKRHSKAKGRAPAYSRLLRQIRWVVQRKVRRKLRPSCQRVRGGRLDGCSLGGEWGSRRRKV